MSFATMTSAPAAPPDDTVPSRPQPYITLGRRVAAAARRRLGLSTRAPGGSSLFFARSLRPLGCRATDHRPGRSRSGGLLRRRPPAALSLRCRHDLNLLYTVVDSGHTHPGTSDRNRHVRPEPDQSRRVPTLGRGVWLSLRGPVDAGPSLPPDDGTTTGRDGGPRPRPRRGRCAHSDGPSTHDMMGHGGHGALSMATWSPTCADVPHRGAALGAGAPVVTDRTRRLPLPCGRAVRDARRRLPAEPQPPPRRSPRGPGAARLALQGKGGRHDRGSFVNRPASNAAIESRCTSSQPTSSL